MRQEEHKFETSLGYRARPCLKNKKRKRKEKNLYSELGYMLKIFKEVPP
jgi:hypothetical protein